MNSRNSVYLVKVTPRNGNVRYVGAKPYIEGPAQTAFPTRKAAQEYINGCNDLCMPSIGAYPPKRAIVRGDKVPDSVTINYP